MVGVDVSDTSLKFVQFERLHAYDKNLSLTHWGDISMPAGIVERGNVHDPKQLAKVLGEVKEKSGAQYVSVSLPEERAYLFETTVPRNLPAREIRNQVEFNLEENVPLSPRDAYFDYAIVGQEAENEKLQVAVAVYAQNTINSYYEACTMAGLLPFAFEIEAQAIARASVPFGSDETFMVVDFGKTRMGIGIVYQGVLMYTSTIDVSGQVMSEAMRAVVGDLAESELTTIKNTKGVIPMSGNEAVAKVIAGILDTITDELSIRIHYWHTRDVDRGKREIKKIILCGGSANLLGMPEYISEKLSITTERAQVWQNAFSFEDMIPSITRKYSYGYATAIGLALRGFTI